MTDIRLRELERRAYQGDLDAARLWLAELLRSGLLDLSRFWQRSAGVPALKNLISEANNPLVVPILEHLLYCSYPHDDAWPRSHAIYGLADLEQGDILLSFIEHCLRQNPPDIHHAFHAIQAFPAPYSESARQFFISLLQHPESKIQQISACRFIEQPHSANIPALASYLSRLDSESALTIKVVDAIGRCGGVAILKEILLSPLYYGPTRVHAAQRLGELLGAEAIPLLLQAQTTMGAVYDEAGNFIHWHGSHDHSDMGRVITHITNRFVLGQEHCNQYCPSCRDEEREPCSLSRSGTYCNICDETRRLWHL